MNTAIAYTEADPNALMNTLGFGSKKINDFESLKSFALQDERYKFLRLFVKKSDEKRDTLDRDTNKMITVSNFHLDYISCSEDDLKKWWDKFDFYVIDNENDYEAKVVKSIKFRD